MRDCQGTELENRNITGQKGEDCNARIKVITVGMSRKRESRPMGKGTYLRHLDSAGTSCYTGMG